MENCSVCKRLHIVAGSINDYKDLAHYHYRDTRLGAFASIFALKHDSARTVGVTVYTMPSPALELRNIATGNMFAGFDRGTQLALVNKSIRCISRVVIEPRYQPVAYN
jgi:hypothetical protein